MMIQGREDIVWYKAGISYMAIYVNSGKPPDIVNLQIGL